MIFPSLFIPFILSTSKGLFDDKNILLILMFVNTFLMTYINFYIYEINFR